MVSEHEKFISFIKMTPFSLLNNHVNLLCLITWCLVACLKVRRCRVHDHREFNRGALTFYGLAANIPAVHRAQFLANEETKADAARCSSLTCPVSSSCRLRATETSLLEGLWEHGCGLPYLPCVPLVKLEQFEKLADVICRNANSWIAHSDYQLLFSLWVIYSYSYLTFHCEFERILK